MKITVYLFVVVSVMCCNAEDETMYSKLLNMASITIQSGSKDAYTKNLESLIENLKKIPEKDIRDIYLLASKNIKIENDDPFDSQQVWLLIGGILTASRSDDLRVEILVHTPPSKVGFLTLGQFIKSLPDEVISRVIRTRAAQKYNSK